MDDDLHALDHLRGHSLVPDPEVVPLLPRLYETDTVPFKHKIVHLRYFTNAGSATWLISEVDCETWLMFGYCDLGLGMAEWGYVSLHELAALSARTPTGFPIYVERDLHWVPKTFASITPSEA